MNSKPIALVTSASGGIGKAIARELAPNYQLVLVARSADKLNALAAQLIGAETIVLDLSIADAVQKLTRELETRNLDIGVLVNNADCGEFWLADPKKLEETIMLNVVTLTMPTRALLPAMAARKAGKVMNVASTAAFMPGPLMVVYYASKAFVLSFSEELSGTGVSVTALCPGPVSMGFQNTAAMQDSKLLSNPLMDSASVARAAVKALEYKQRVVIPGTSNQLLALLPRFVPRALIPGIVKNAQSRRYG